MQIEKVFSSPYLRCLETIRPLLERVELPLAVEDDLRERLITETFVDGF
jgi:broad specificity phosphatase PhoE